MRFLMIKWKAYGQDDFNQALTAIGYEIDNIIYDFHNFEKDNEFSKQLKERIDTKKYDAVLSFNFFQLISELCEVSQIPYISWVCDSPTTDLYMKAVLNKCNYIFIFDKALYQDVKNLGVEKVFHLPLAVNVERLDKLLNAQDEYSKYHSYISFVGNLYNNKKVSYDMITNLPDYYKGYFDGIMNAQLNIYGYNFLEEMLTDGIFNGLSTYVNLDVGDSFIGTKKMLFASLFLGFKVTSLERIKLLNSLSKEFKVDLYTGSDTRDLPWINNKGYIDYYTVMPKVFRYSDINLNITLKTIKTGIPLRVLDILGSGGFVISNYQSELLECFEAGKDLVIYENEEDLHNKIYYYLEHDDERRQIAANGYRKVKEFHNYNIRVKEIMKTVFG